MLAKFAPQATCPHSISSGSSSEAVAKPRASELTRVFNIVNEAKESGITLEAAGGAAVLPVLDALVKDGRVRRVFDMMQVRCSITLAHSYHCMYVETDSPSAVGCHSMQRCRFLASFTH
jgi:isopentenyl diphosphate isomerase/L-lactate dehydrogenase-like FMN-dependent dehydrogenase